MQAEWEEVVGSGPLATSGVITSPNYPTGNYPSNQDNLKSSVTVAEGKKIELTITDLNIEAEENCDYDSLKIYDGMTLLAVSVSSHDLDWICSRLQKLCGTTLPSSPYITQSNTLHLYFTSDGSVEYKGFSASWKQIG